MKWEPPSKEPTSPVQIAPSPLISRVGPTMKERLEAGTLTTCCIGCGGHVPEMDGPTHRYMESSPGCWHLYGQVLAREYADPAFGALHRLTVDAYAVQHPGRPSPQAIQSVCVHLLSLFLVLERNLAATYATRVMGGATRNKDRFVWLIPPESLGEITVASVAGVTPHEHTERVRAWAESAWSAWSEHHATVRSWVPA